MLRYRLSALLMVLCGWLPSLSETEVYAQDHVCENGVTVPDPDSNDALVRDCKILLDEVKDDLIGNNRTTLNWNGQTSIHEWKGVITGARAKKVFSRPDMILESQDIPGSLFSPDIFRPGEFRIYMHCFGYFPPRRKRYPEGFDGVVGLSWDMGSPNQADALRGTLPAALGKLSELHTLNLDFNELTGPIPPQLGSLSNLMCLDIQGTGLTGSIPEALGNLSNLDDLDLHDNNLTGSIPEALGNLSNLTQLSLYNNQLTGAIPDILGEMSNVVYMTLDKNHLRGCIPEELEKKRLEFINNIYYAITINPQRDGIELPAEGSPECVSSIMLSADPDRVKENAGAPTIEVSATLLRDAWSLDRDIPVSLNVAGITATGGGVDYADVRAFPVTIPAGETSAGTTFTLTVVDDGIYEGDETIEITGTPPEGFHAVVPDTVTIVEDQEAPSIMLSADPDRVKENAGAPTIEVSATLLGDAWSLDRDMPVSLNVAGITATGGGVDYADVRAFPVTIPAGETSADTTFTLTVVNDLDDEGDETIEITGTPSWGDFEVVSDTLTIIDNDIRLIADPDTVYEAIGSGGGNGGVIEMIDVNVYDEWTVSAALSRESAVLEEATAVLMRFEIEGETVRPDVSQDGDIILTVLRIGEEFRFPVTIPAGGTSADTMTTLRVVDDNIVEGDETFQIAGTTTPTGFDVIPGTLTIIDDDVAADRITLSVLPDSVAENETSPKIMVVRADFFYSDGDSTVLPQPTEVSLTVEGVTAEAGEDYAAVDPFPVTIPAGELSGEALFTLAMLDDSEVEAEETIEIVGTAAGFTVFPAEVTITDDDIAAEAITLSVSPAAVDESGAPQPITVTASLPVGSATLLQPTEVSLTVEGVTAEAGEDYAAVDPFPVTIPAGRTSGEEPFTLTVLDDEVVEAEETIEIVGTAAGFTVFPAEVTITDDDVAAEAITLSVSPDTVYERGAPQPITVTASFPSGSARLPQPTEVSLTVEGVTAEAGEDYAAVDPFPVTIPAGELSGEALFTLAMLDDSEVEAEETIEIVGTAAGFTVFPAEVTITDDDVAAEAITLSVSPDTVYERGAPQPITVTASFPSGSARLPQPTEVSLTVEGVTAEAGEDYAAVDPFPVTIPAGELSGEALFTLAMLDDSEVEAEETIEIVGTAAGFTVFPAEVTITDDDIAAEAITLSVSPAAVDESGAPQPITVTASFPSGSARLPQPTEVSLTVEGVTAEAGEDYAAVDPFPVTIPAGRTAGEEPFTLTVIDDEVVEAEETIEIVGTAAGFTVFPAEVTITDDDIAADEITLSVSPAAVDESGAPRPITVTASLPVGSATLLQPTEVSLTVEGVTAEAGEDYAAVDPFPVTIPAGRTAGEEPFTLTVIDDEVVEAEETIEIVGTAAGFTVFPAEVTITDDDVAAEAITLSVSPAAVDESGAPQPITVTASFPLGSARLPQPTEVSLTVEGVTAEAGEDYAAVDPFPVTIPAGELSGEALFTLAVLDDSEVEAEETIEIVGTAAGFTVFPAEVTITDDDIAAEAITLSVSPAAVDESGAPQPITVTASFPLGSARLPQPTEVSLTVEGVTAEAGEDYAAVDPFPVTIPAGRTSGEEPFTLTVIDDSEVEPDETIAVEGTAAGFTVSSAEVTITDDDVAALGSITICPDPFTPNDDSFNDRVKFSIDGLEDPTLSIYTLEGVLIHTSDDLAVMDFRCNESPNSSSSTALFWDGRDDDGQDQPAGIYLFAIRDATSVVTAGRLTLAR